VNLNNFFAELKRRNVYKVAVAYAVVGWLLLQAASILLPTFEAPGWAMKVLVAVIAAGFLIALVVAWAFELTPQGIKRAEDVDLAAPGKNRAWIVVVVIAGALSIGLFFLGRYTAPRQLADSVSSAKSIAVLPFENRSEDKANAYFADGIQDEILTRLAKIADLKVISRTSTQRYKSSPENLPEIAKQLGVAHVLEGSVQKAGEQVRVTVQLIRSASDSHVWAEHYDRKLTDIFAVESEIAEKIAHSLQAKLTPREQQAVTARPTENTAAYDAYLRGLDFMTRPGMSLENLTGAADQFSQAVHLDPNFALAWASLSGACASLYFDQLDTTPARKEAARVAAETATKLAPDAPETLMANAFYRYHIQRDYEGARILFEKIRKEVPSNSDAIEALAFIARRQSRWSDALKLFEEAARLNPRNPELLINLAWTFSMLRQIPAATEIADRALAILPGDPGLLTNKALLYQMAGDVPAAASALAQLDPALSGESIVFARSSQFLLERRYSDGVEFLKKTLSKPGSKLGFTTGLFGLSLAYVQKLAGDKIAAKATYLHAVDELETVQREQPTNALIVSGLAAAHAGLGNKEAALREGERAIAMLPATEDPVVGPIIEESLARTEVEVGEFDRALARLERLLITPYGAYPITQATLRLDPSFDPIRSHPRFQKLVSGPEPKTIYK
jgi:TolB-like protein